MAKFHIRLGPTPRDAEVWVNGRRMENVVSLRIQQSESGPPLISVTIPAEELIVEGEGTVDMGEVKG